MKSAVAPHCERVRVTDASSCVSLQTSEALGCDSPQAATAPMATGQRDSAAAAMGTPLDIG
jgi:hypothetical protein